MNKPTPHIIDLRQPAKDIVRQVLLAQEPVVLLPASLLHRAILRAIKSEAGFSYAPNFPMTQDTSDVMVFYGFSESTQWSILEEIGLSALICNAKMFGTTLFRSMYFLPVVMSFATASFIWIWLYSEMYGVLVYLIKWLGIVQEDEFNVFSTGETAMWAVNIMVTWKFSGIQMIILIAGMQSIRDDFYEASTLMGASRLQNIIYITAPLLKHSTALALVISIAGSIQAFEQFFIMTAGGPANQTRTLMMLTVDTAFDYFKLGPASAMSIFIMMILLFLTVVQLKLFRR